MFNSVSIRKWQCLAGRWKMIREGSKGVLAAISHRVDFQAATYRSRLKRVVMGEKKGKTNAEMARWDCPIRLRLLLPNALPTLRHHST